MHRLSVDAASISRWVYDLNQEQKKERQEKIWQLWLACHTLDQIGKTVELSESQVSRTVKDLQKLHLQEMQVPDSLQTFNLWNFQNNDARYGMDYPGRIPGQIVENILYYYTEPFDTVVDPMGAKDTVRALGQSWLTTLSALTRKLPCKSPKRGSVHLARRCDASNANDRITRVDFCHSWRIGYVGR